VRPHLECGDDNRHLRECKGEERGSYKHGEDAESTLRSVVRRYVSVADRGQRHDAPVDGCNVQLLEAPRRFAVDVAERRDPRGGAVARRRFAVVADHNLVEEKPKARAPVHDHEDDDGKADHPQYAVANSTDDKLLPATPQALQLRHLEQLHQAEKAQELREAQHEENMLGGASQIVSKIRVNCNGT
jgi:hypothetical protein